MNETTTNQRQQSSGAALRTHTDIHHGSRRRSRSTRRHTIALIASVTGLVLLVILVVYLFGAIAKYNVELTAQRAALEGSESGLHDARAELERIRSELDALVKQRLPHLEPLQFDRVIRIKEPYIRNVLFSGAQSDDRRDYKYTIILENVDLPPTVLTVRVLLFDRTGVQIGGDSLDNVGMLRSGDQQTLSGDAQLFMDATPEYFYIDSGKD